MLSRTSRPRIKSYSLCRWRVWMHLKANNTWIGAIIRALQTTLLVLTSRVVQQVVLHISLSTVVKIRERHPALVETIWLWCQRSPTGQTTRCSRRLVSMTRIATWLFSRILNKTLFQRRTIMMRARSNNASNRPKVVEISKTCVAVSRSLQPGRMLLLFIRKPKWTKIKVLRILMKPESQ